MQQNSVEACCWHSSLAALTAEGASFRDSPRKQAAAAAQLFRGVRRHAARRGAANG